MHIFVGTSSSGLETDLQELIQLLANSGFASTDMTDDELAKEHIHNMSGGRAPIYWMKLFSVCNFQNVHGGAVKFFDGAGRTLVYQSIPLSESRRCFR